MMVFRSNHQNNIPGVIADMKSHANNAHRQRKGCTTISNMAKCQQKKRKTIAKAGGVSVVIEAMKSHRRDEQVQLQGCAALRNLSHRNAENATLIVRHPHGIEAVVQAMELYPQNIDLQRKACGAILNLAMGKSNLRSFAEIDGCAESIVRSLNNALALEGVSSNVDLLVECCGALLCLAQNAKLRDAIASNGCIPTVIAALQQHPYDADLQMEGISLLESLSVAPSHCIRVVKAGAVEMTLHAMRLHVKDRDLQRSGCGLLASVASATEFSDDSSSILDCILNSDALRVLMTALRRRPQDGIVFVHVYTVLAYTDRLQDLYTPSKEAEVEETSDKPVEMSDADEPPTEQESKIRGRAESPARECSGDSDDDVDDYASLHGDEPDDSPVPAEPTACDTGAACKWAQFGNPSSRICSASRENEVSSPTAVSYSIDDDVVHKSDHTRKLSRIRSLSHGNLIHLLQDSEADTIPCQSTSPTATPSRPPCPRARTTSTSSLPLAPPQKPNQPPRHQMSIQSGGNVIGKNSKRSASRSRIMERGKSLSHFRSNSIRQLLTSTPNMILPSSSGHMKVESDDSPRSGAKPARAASNARLIDKLQLG